MIALIGRALLVTLALTVAGPIAAPVIGLQPPVPVPGSSPITPGWLLASNAVVAAALVWIAHRAARRGWPLVAGLFAVAFGIGTVQSLIEAWVFDVVPIGEVVRLLGQAAIATLAACAVTAWLTRRDPILSVHRTTPTLLQRPALSALVAIAAVYTTAYFAAGVLAYPFFGGFYEQRRLPSPLLIAALQFFVRGPLFGLLLALLVQSTLGTRLSRAVVAGVAMSFFLGVAPLILPNPYLPDAVRWAHFVEVSTSNFIVGMIAGWILTRPSTDRLEIAVASAPPLW